MSYQIYTLELSDRARLGIGPLPAEEHLPSLRAWRPGAVISLTTAEEMSDVDLRRSFGPIWHHMPVTDFGVPGEMEDAFWARLSPNLHMVLDGGGGVFAHCKGGKGRSGMVLMRLMVERGVAPDDALGKLRSIRPGAVETDAQLAWASMLG